MTDIKVIHIIQLPTPPATGLLSLTYEHESTSESLLRHMYLVITQCLYTLKDPATMNLHVSWLLAHQPLMFMPPTPNWTLEGLAQNVLLTTVWPPGDLYTMINPKTIQINMKINYP